MRARQEADAYGAAADHPGLDGIHVLEHVPLTVPFLESARALVVLGSIANDHDNTARTAKTAPTVAPPVRAARAHAPRGAAAPPRQPGIHDPAAGPVATAEAAAALGEAGCELVVVYLPETHHTGAEVERLAAALA